jgi:hypothetical protein
MKQINFTPARTVAIIVAFLALVFSITAIPFI